MELVKYERSWFHLIHLTILNVRCLWKYSKITNRSKFNGSKTLKAVLTFYVVQWNEMKLDNVAHSSKVKHFRLPLAVLTGSRVFPLRVSAFISFIADWLRIFESGSHWVIQVFRENTHTNWELWKSYWVTKVLDSSAHETSKLKHFLFIKKNTSSFIVISEKIYTVSSLTGILEVCSLFRFHIDGRNKVS